jgi:hypothetical protein
MALIEFKSYKKIAIVLIFLLISCFAQGQDTNVKAAKSNSHQLLIGKEKYSKWSIGVSEGFKTIKSLIIYDYSLQVSRTIVVGQRIRLEAGYRTSAPSLEQNWGSTAMIMKADINSLIVGVSYDWFPFVKSDGYGQFLQSFKVSCGMSYLDKPEYVFDARLKNPLVWRDITFSVEEVGVVSTTINTSNVQPYVGVGYDQFYLGKNINFSFNSGFVYQGRPKVTIVATEMLKATSESGPKLQSNLRSYQVIPFIQLQIQYNL